LGGEDFEKFEKFEKFEIFLNFHQFSPRLHLTKTTKIEEEQLEEYIKLQTTTFPLHVKSLQQYPNSNNPPINQISNFIIKSSLLY
jgi:hypothetical protein